MLLSRSAVKTTIVVQRCQFVLWISFNDSLTSLSAVRTHDRPTAPHSIQKYFTYKLIVWLNTGLLGPANEESERGESLERSYDKPYVSEIERFVEQFSSTAGSLT